MAVSGRSFASSQSLVIVMVGAELTPARRDSSESQLAGRGSKSDSGPATTTRMDCNVGPHGQYHLGLGEPQASPL